MIDELGQRRLEAWQAQSPEMLRNDITDDMVGTYGPMADWGLEQVQEARLRHENRVHATYVVGLLLGVGLTPLDISCVASEISELMEMPGLFSD